MKRIFALLLSACCLTSGMAFNQAQQLFLLCVRNAHPTPPLPYDSDVEYIESTGTQWIDTGLPAREGLLVECVGNIISWGENARLFGCVTGGRGREFGVSTGRTTDTQVYLGSAMSGCYTSSVPIGQSGHTFDLDSTAGSKVFRIDGNVISMWSTSLGVSLANVFLFANAANSSYASVSRVSSFLAKDATTGQMLVDLVSVRFTNEQGVSEGAMYDRVSGQLFRNAGTGAFTIGPDK